MKIVGAARDRIFFTALAACAGLWSSCERAPKPETGTISTVQSNESAQETNLTSGQNQLFAGCRRNDSNACLKLSEELLEGRPKSDGRLMTQVATRGCELGKADACAIAGAGHHFGGAGAIDRARAAQFYERACAGQSAIGCTSWSFGLVEGWGIPKEPSTTLKPLTTFCEQSDQLVTCAGLAVLRLLAEPESREVATQCAKLFERACTDGYAASCAHLSGLYDDGRGVPRDVRRARVLCEEAQRIAEEGSGDAPDRQAHEPCPRRVKVVKSSSTP